MLIVTCTPVLSVNAIFVCFTIASTWSDTLVDILTFHAVAGEVVFSTDLNCTGPLTMANGKTSRTICEGVDIFQKGAGNPRDTMPQIVDTDIEACNGVVHVVNQVMLPIELGLDPPTDVDTSSPVEVISSFPSGVPTSLPSYGDNETCTTIVGIACETPATTTLCELIDQYGLDDALSDGIWTVFAPTNDAFAAIASVIPTLSSDQITDILLFHGVRDKEILSTDLVCKDVRTR
jgi:uncharacterized surface protein with fasciclin (FAS1) repeats